MNPPKISVIVPIYKAEKTLRACLKSLAEQTLADIEVLMVNNDSPDGVQTIMDEFARKDARFVPLFRKGGLAGGARNEGLKHARGEYAAFVDADDWTEPAFCAALYARAQEQDADIAICPFMETDGRGAPREAPRETKQSLPLDRRQNTPEDFMRASARHNVPWRKIIRRKLIADAGLSFPENAAYEDLAFVTACFLLADKVIFIPQALYVHRHTPGTFSSSPLQKDPSCAFASFSHVRGPLQKAGAYEAVKEPFEYYLLEIICGGENGGNGLLKRGSPAQIQTFFAQSRAFYLSLPRALFRGRNLIFRVKYALLRAALKLNAPRLPQCYRLPLNIFTALCLPFARVPKS